MVRVKAEKKSLTVYDIINLTGRRLEAIDSCISAQSLDPVLFQKGKVLVNFLGFEPDWSGYYLVLNAVLVELVEVKRLAFEEGKNVGVYQYR